MSQESAPVSTKHPTALYYIFWGEFAERCCYYGMRAILSLYMTQLLMIKEADANSYYSWFKTACYLLPLLGGFVADKFIGRYWSIVWFSIPYVIGQFLLASADQDYLFLSLGLLAFGSGMIKPNISSLLGMTYDQKRPGQIALRGQGFYLFYFSINIGAFISMLTLPLLRDYIQKHYDMKLAYQVAFSIPAVLMIGALIAFAWGKKYYAVEKTEEKEVLSPQERRKQWMNLIPLMGVFLIITMFWIPYEHNDTQWVFFARDFMNLNTPWLEYFGGPEKVSADAFQFINSLSVLILIPFFAWFWPKYDPTGRRISPIQKMSLGFIFTGCGPLIMTICAYMAQGGEKVSCLWLVLAYFLLTLGEVLVYGTGLEFSFAQAPPSMKSLITACFLLTNAISNMINSYWGRTYNNPESSFSLTPLEYFSIDTGIPIFASILILIVGRRFHLEHINGK